MIPQRSYTDFSAQLHRRLMPERPPASGTIEVTRRCSLACHHCYNNLPMGDAGARDRELSTAEHFRLIDDLVEDGCLWLLYTGGEIFARADFLEIYTYAWKKGLLITLFTNATLISERIADHLARHRPFAVEVTLYGATRETYERLTDVPGSYDRCLRGVKLLAERGLPISIKTVAVSLNWHEIAEMERLAEELVGPGSFKFDGLINARVDCGESPLAVRLKPHELVSLDLGDPERESEFRRLIDYQRGLAPAPPSSGGCACGSQTAAGGAGESLYACGAGLTAFAVDPYGGLSMCVLSESEKYDLRDGSFRDGWTHFLKAIRDRKRSRPGKCASCGLKSLCGTCPATSQLEHGDPESGVPYFCHVAHLRAHVLGVEPPAHGECEFCRPNGASDFHGSRYGELLESAKMLEETRVDPEWPRRSAEIAAARLRHQPVRTDGLIQIQVSSRPKMTAAGAV